MPLRKVPKNPTAKSHAKSHARKVPKMSPWELKVAPKVPYILLKPPSLVAKSTQAQSQLGSEMHSIAINLKVLLLLKPHLRNAYVCFSRGYQNPSNFI